MEEKKYLNKLFTYRALSLPIFFILSVLFLLPLVLVFSKGLEAKTILNVFHDKNLEKIFLFTINQASLSALLSTVIGLYGAYLTRFVSKKFKRLLLSILILPFLLPSILVVLGFINVWGNNGYVNFLLEKLFNIKPISFLYSFKAIIAAHLFYNIPLAIIIISSYWNKIGNNLENVSYSLGVNKVQTFFTLTLKRLAPSLLSSFLLIFLYCFHSFAIVMMLGSSVKLTTLEVEIFRLSRNYLSFSQASALSIISLLFCLVVALIYFILYKSKVKEQNNYFVSKAKLNPLHKFFAIIFSFLLFIFLYAPIVSIIVKSFTSSTGFTLNNYSKMFSDKHFIDSLINSVAIATLTSLLTLLASFILAHNLRFSKKNNSIAKQLFIILPLATSSIIIGFGYYLISTYLINFSPIIICSFAHMIIAIPISTSIIKQSYDKLNINVQKSALSLDSKFRMLVFIDISYLKKALFSSFIISFALSIGELNSTLIITKSNFTTLVVMLYYSITSCDLALSCSIGTLLMLICGIITAIVYSGVKDNE